MRYNKTSGRYSGASGKVHGGAFPGSAEPANVAGSLRAYGATEALMRRVA